MIRNLDFLTEQSVVELKRLFGENPKKHEVCNYTYSKVDCEIELDKTFFTAIETFFDCARAIKGMNVWLSSFSSFKRDGFGYVFIAFDYEDLDPEYYEEEDGTITSAMDYRESQLQKLFKLDNVINYEVRIGGCGFFTLNYIIKL